MFSVVINMILNNHIGIVVLVSVYTRKKIRGSYDVLAYPVGTN